VPCHPNAVRVRGAGGRWLERGDVGRVDGRVVRFAPEACCRRRYTDLHFEVHDDALPESLPPTPPVA